jgi:AraC-like DNA-binding protein
MEELAAVARMGVSTLHHQFRALTAMSPLQYQKQLRLQTARQRMLVDGIDATNAAYEVGYASVSQFNREYGRFFGQPPMRISRPCETARLWRSTPLKTDSPSRLRGGLLSNVANSTKHSTTSVSANFSGLIPINAAGSRHPGVEAHSFQ